jgi:hypothetical protein
MARRGEAEGGVGDLQIEMLPHFIRVQHLANLERDLGGAAQRIPLAPDRGFDAREVLLGRRQQFVALAGAFGGEVGVAADDQPFAGKVGRGDAGHVALVEQGELQGAAVHQFLDRRGA